MDRISLVDRDGVKINPGEDYSYSYDWSNLGSLTAGVTTPAVGARDRTSIAALVTAGSVLELSCPNAVWLGPRNSVPTQPNGAKSYELRMRGTGTADTTFVVDCLAAAGPLASEHYTRRATLTGTLGTQVHTAASIYFMDRIKGSNEAWITDPAEVNPATPNNYIGSYVFRVYGYLSFVFVPTTIPANQTLYIDVRRFS